ncbi:hypothetical protein [Bradyrhizobium sp. 63_E2_N1_3]|uniref:hypothetical protein n=1 Tax=Bradyrhizobium sp. 63_E2_N1_3 TaxID=3240373 RepID=UPI003F8A3D1B
MTSRNPPDLHEEINRRIKLHPHLIAAAAREGEISEYEDQLIEDLNKLRQSYSDTRLYEEARKTPKLYENPEPLQPGDEYYDEEWVRSGGWGPGIWKELYPPAKGQPPHEALRLIYDDLKELWTELRSQIDRAAGRKMQSREKKIPRRKRMLTWAPVFAKEYVEIAGEVREQMTPQNPSAKLFLTVAKLFDPLYTASNCYSVVERVKIERKSPEEKLKLRERRRKAARIFRAKPQSERSANRAKTRT